MIEPVIVAPDLACDPFWALRHQAARPPRRPNRRWRISWPILGSFYRPIVFLIRASSPNPHHPALVRARLASLMPRTRDAPRLPTLCRLGQHGQPNCRRRSGHWPTARHYPHRASPDGALFIESAPARRRRWCSSGGPPCGAGRYALSRRQARTPRSALAAGAVDYHLHASVLVPQPRGAIPWF